MTAERETAAYCAGVNAAILLVVTRSSNETDAQLVLRLHQLLPDAIPVTLGDDWNKKLT